MFTFTGSATKYLQLTIGCGATKLKAASRLAPPALTSIRLVFHSDRGQASALGQRSGIAVLAVRSVSDPIFVLKSSRMTS